MNGSQQTKWAALLSLSKSAQSSLNIFFLCFNVVKVFFFFKSCAVQFITTFPYLSLNFFNFIFLNVLTFYGYCVIKVLCLTYY